MRIAAPKKKKQENGKGTVVHDRHGLVLSGLVWFIRGSKYQTIYQIKKYETNQKLPQEFKITPPNGYPCFYEEVFFLLFWEAEMVVHFGCLFSNGCNKKTGLLTRTASP